MLDQDKQEFDQSTTKFLMGVAHLLPGIVALILAVLISIVLAWILAIVVRRFFVSIRFDERLSRWGFSSLRDWAPLERPNLFVSRATPLLIILTGFFIGIATFDAGSPPP